MKKWFSLLLCFVSSVCLAGQINPLSNSTSQTVNLTTLGTEDWEYWNGTNGTPTLTRDSGPAKISNYTILGTCSWDQFGGGNTFSWSNGTPTVSGTGAQGANCDTTTVPGDGFQFTVPASTAVQTIYVYTTTHGNNTTLTATLSDGSAAQYVNTCSSTTDYCNWSIIYSANSASTLTITVTNASNNGFPRVSLQAVALQSGPASPIITTGTLPTATQYQIYATTPQTAWGGTPPYTWSVTSNDSTLPEGMTINSSTGVISSSYVGGQGVYGFQIQLTDSVGVTTQLIENIPVAADNTWGGCSIFPPNSIFHHRVDSLPVDTSPAAPIPAAYSAAAIRVFFGSQTGGLPNGIPFIRVPYNQPLVPIDFDLYGDESDPSPYPFPAYAPIEGTANNVGGDQHVLVLQTAGGGNSCQLWEVWQGMYDSNNTWTASNGAYWNLGSNALRTFGWTSGDAAGLPIMPLLVNYDEVASGTVTHPIRFTLNHMLNYIVWPGRHAAGVSDCLDSSGNAIPVGSLLSQSSPPASCSFSGPSGEIYRLKASVDISVCASDPQATVILTAMKQYGIILADNGESGGLIGTPDSRWNDTDLNCLTNFTMNQFEPVNVSSLMVDPDSGETGSSIALPLSPTITNISAQ